MDFKLLLEYSLLCSVSCYLKSFQPLGNLAYNILLFVTCYHLPNPLYDVLCLLWMSDHAFISLPMCCLDLRLVHECQIARYIIYFLASIA